MEHPTWQPLHADLAVDEDLYILTHTAELVIGAVILLFLITGAKPLFGKFLRPYKKSGRGQAPA